MEWVIENCPYSVPFTMLRAVLRQSRIDVQDIQPVRKDDGTILALIRYTDGAEQRVPITHLATAEAVYRVLVCVRETFPLRDIQWPDDAL